jgi:hypothetical protein
VLTVTDSIGVTAKTTVSLTINPAPAIVLGAVSLPAGVLGKVYSGSASASGGTGALIWSATGLPPGLTISSSGSVSGTPSTAGTYSVVLTVKDSKSSTASVTRAVVISAAQACTVPAGATKGLEGQGTITATSGNLITIKTPRNQLVKVTVPGCAKIEFNGAKGFALGQAFEWHGYSTPALGNTATEVTIN